MLEKYKPNSIRGTFERNKSTLLKGENCLARQNLYQTCRLFVFRWAANRIARVKKCHGFQLQH